MTTYDLAVLVLQAIVTYGPYVIQVATVLLGALAANKAKQFRDEAKGHADTARRLGS